MASPEPVSTESLDQQILSLLGTKTKDGVEAAVALFEGSAELVDIEILMALDEQMSKWGLRPQVSKNELDRRAQLDRERQRVASPFPRIQELRAQFLSAMNEWYQKNGQADRLSDGLEAIPAQIILFEDSLKTLLRARECLQGMKKALPNIRAYYLDLYRDGNIIRFGEKVAARVKPQTELISGHNKLLVEYEEELRNAEVNILNHAEQTTKSALESFSATNTECIAMRLAYEAAMAEIGQEALEAATRFAAAVAEIVRPDGRDVGPLATRPPTAEA
ncbi:MAG: hypothetical protein WC924_03820 [Candidatus Gracilibacteria bacterium]